MVAMYGAGKKQEDLKKQSLAILDLTNQVLKSERIKASGHLDYFTRQLTVLNDKTSGGSKLIPADVINKLRQEISDGNQGKAVATCSCVSCRQDRGVAERRELELERIRGVESQRQVEQRQAAQAQREQVALASQRLKDEKKQQMISSWKQSPTGALYSLVLWLGIYIAVTASIDGVAAKVAFTVPNLIVLSFVGILLVRAGYRVGLGHVSIFMTVIFLATGCLMGLSRYFGAVQSVLRFFTPHVVTNLSTFGQSLVWLMAFWFFAFASHQPTSSSSKSS